MPEPVDHIKKAMKRQAALMTAPPRLRQHVLMIPQPPSLYRKFVHLNFGRIGFGQKFGIAPISLLAASLVIGVFVFSLISTNEAEFADSDETDFIISDETDPFAADSLDPSGIFTTTYPLNQE